MLSQHNLPQTNQPHNYLNPNDPISYYNDKNDNAIFPTPWHTKKEDWGKKIKEKKYETKKNKMQSLTRKSHCELIATSNLS